MICAAGIAWVRFAAGQALFRLTPVLARGAARGSPSRAGRRPVRRTRSALYGEWRRRKLRTRAIPPALGLTFGACRSGRETRPVAMVGAATSLRHGVLCCRMRRGLHPMASILVFALVIGAPACSYRRLPANLLCKARSPEGSALRGSAKASPLPGDDARRMTQQDA